MSLNKQIEKEYKPSVYQEAIFDFIQHGQGNVVVEAEAGSGKSTTLIKCLSLMPQDAHILLCAFNNSIVDDLKKKIKDLPNRKNIDCKTIHSLGYSILKSNFGKKISNEINEFKYSSYVYNNIRELSNDFYSTLTKKNREKYIENIIKFVNFSRYYLFQTPKDMTFIETHFNVSCIKDEKEIAVKVLDWGKENYTTLDFTDMVWLPNVLNCKPYKHLYDWIALDECQDVEKEERELILKCTKMSTRMISVGQEIQCQPEGTKILMSDGTQKNIEDIKVGDSVVTFSEDKEIYSTHSNSGIIDGVDSHIDNRFISIETNNGLRTKYTPEHICYARIIDTYKKNYCIYLGIDDNENFSLGKSTFLGLNQKIQEKEYQKVWLLTACQNINEAESIRVKLSSKLEEKSKNGLEILNEYHRDFNYPIYKGDDETGILSFHLSPINACNLMENYMEMSCFEVEDNRGKYSSINHLEYLNEKNKVYSLSVVHNHNYVADGILTHNCINQWKGADENSFKELRNLPNTITLPLSISYRCPKNVVKLANRFSPNMKPKEDAIDGEVKYQCELDEINDGDMVLCRVNAPLLQMYYELTKLGKTSYICGKEFGDALIKLIDSTNEEKLSKDLKHKGVFPKLYDDLFSAIDNIMQTKHVSFEMALDDNEICQMYDNIQALEAISKDCEDAGCIKENIIQLFSDSKKKGITLSTIHKAKGLECDNVYICCPSLLPAKSAKAPWELRQESNLEYVAFTRAKVKLGFLNEDNFNLYSSNAQQKANNLSLKKILVFNLYGNNKRCSAITPSAEAARYIIDNSKKIEIKAKNSIDLNQNQKKSNVDSFNLNNFKMLTKKKIKRQIKL